VDLHHVGAQEIQTLKQPVAVCGLWAQPTDDASPRGLATCCARYCRSLGVLKFKTLGVIAWEEAPVLE